MHLICIFNFVSFKRKHECVVNTSVYHCKISCGSNNRSPKSQGGQIDTPSKNLVQNSPVKIGLSDRTLHLVADDNNNKSFIKRRNYVYIFYCAARAPKYLYRIMLHDSKHRQKWKLSSCLKQIGFHKNTC